MKKHKPMSRAPAQGGTEDSDVEVEGLAAGEAALEHVQGMWRAEDQEKSATKKVWAISRGYIQSNLSEATDVLIRASG